MPLISVIIPVFNAEKTIIKALESVKNQTFGFENFKIFIINDGSTDGSSDKIKNYIVNNPELNVTLISQENKGVSAARNEGLKICNGEFIALLDADDEWYSGKTDQQINIFNNNSEVDFLSCRRKNHTIQFPYKVSKNNLSKITFRKLLIRNETQPSTVIFKRKILANTGYFDDAQKYAEDHNYWLRISENNKMYILNEELVLAGGGKRTFGVSGLSANLIEMEAGFQKNLKEMYYKKRINWLQYFLFRQFYTLKYYLRLFRNLKQQ